MFQRLLDAIAVLRGRKVAVILRPTSSSKTFTTASGTPNGGFDWRLA